MRGYLNMPTINTSDKTEGSETMTNQLTYRGYFYDFETGLYYLQSRYYAPNWGRFINADKHFDTGTGLLGTNLYIYCDDNPIMKIDPNGEGWITGMTDFDDFTMYKGNTTTRTVSTTFDPKSIDWDSSCPSVVEITKGAKSKTATFKAKDVGTAKIWVTAQKSNGNYASESFVITVIAKPTIKLDYKDKTVLRGNSTTLKATVSPAGSSAVEWSSTNTSIATVNQSGVVTTKAPGIVYIQAKAKAGGNLAKCLVIVPMKWTSSTDTSKTIASERYLYKRMQSEKPASWVVSWNQNKVTSVYVGCADIYKHYGIWLDPMVLLSIIIVEGTGSFNTSSVNLAGDGQNGIETNFAVDFMKANDFMFGKLLAFAYYNAQFCKTVKDNNAKDGIDGNGDFFQYANWNTALIRLNSKKMDHGVYAGAYNWHTTLKSVLNSLAGAGSSDSINTKLLSITKDKVEAIVKKAGFAKSYNHGTKADPKWNYLPKECFFKCVKSNTSENYTGNPSSKYLVNVRFDSGGYLVNNSNVRLINLGK
jgi:RHS repeat-associated protein